MNAIAAAKQMFGGNSLAKTIMRTSFNNFFVLIITTLTSILTARMLGADGKGELSAVLFWPALLGSLIGFGLPTSLIYNVKNKTGSVPELLSLALRIQLPVSLLAGAAAWFCMPLWLANYDASVIAVAQIYTLAAVPLAVLTNLCIALAQSLDGFGVYNGMLFFVPFVNLCVLTVIWQLGLLDVAGASAVSFGAGLITLVWAAFRLRKQLLLKDIRWSVSRSSYRPFYSYGARVYGMELMGTLSSQTDKIVIVALLSPADFGLYSVVYALSRVFNVVQNAITNVIFPKVTGMDNEVIIEKIGRAFRISMLGMAVIIVPSLFIGHFMLGLLYGSTFLAGSSTFYLLSLECIIGGGSWILASAFNALGRPGLVLVRQIAAYLVTAALFFVFTPWLGLPGIALALLSGALVRLAVSVLSFPVFFKVPLGRILFDASDFKFVMQMIRKGRRKPTNEEVLEYASNG
ncbi:lipopolysaccharide biosynthesis protein [Paenibacillus pinistramenti]|uniref:lipopolysaccharide biosynthesis protein n=1 Tax=Paenibacillus pinistramenti TaxID=1768003 RepID=UPI0011094A2A|nr:oligosaccharide flippase family protein [Paenibacillus pinistramenti]